MPIGAQDGDPAKRPYRTRSCCTTLRTENVIRYIGTIWPGSRRRFRHRYRIALVDTRSELRGMMRTKDCRAGCLIYQNPHRRKRLGVLYFLRDHVTDADVVHRSEEH